MQLMKEKTARYDATRHALLAPIRLPSEARDREVNRGAGLRGCKYRVLYLRNGREHKTPFFYRKKNAEKALNIVKRKYGDAIIMVD